MGRASRVIACLLWMIGSCSTSQTPSPEVAEAEKVEPTERHESTPPAEGAEEVEDGEDPFAAGADALAVSEPEVSRSLRPKLAMQRLKQGEVLVEVRAVDDAGFPICVLSARVLRKGDHRSQKVRKLLGRGRTYRFVARLTMRGGEVDLQDPVTRQNLGICYHPPGTRLALEVTGVDLGAKTFQVGSVRR